MFETETSAIMAANTMLQKKKDIISDLRELAH